MLFSGRRRGLQTAVPCLFVMAAVLSAGAVEGYKNYTVGEGKGWYDGGAVDYQAWADGYNFSLGDFLSEYITTVYIQYSCSISVS